MKKNKNNYFLKLISIFLIGIFTINNGWAKKCLPPVELRVNYFDFEPKDIGEQMSVPVWLKFNTGKKKESIKFDVAVVFPTEKGVNVNSINIKSVSYDLAQEPSLVVYIPVSVTGEGVFNVVVNSHIKFIDDGQPNNAACFSGLDWNQRMTFSFLAFKGKYTFARATDGAFRKRVNHILIKANNDLSELIVHHNNKLLALYEKNYAVLAEMQKHNSLPDEDIVVITSAIDKGMVSLKQEYYKKYPPLKSKAVK